MNLRIPKLNAAGHRLLVMSTVIAGLLAWLWPIGVGGKMPVGGDVTSFFLGFMGVLSDSLKAGRLPVWNDLWGYGFPGIGESQMGVYYPPHLLLYGVLSTEWAYVASLVLHTLWGGAGAWWAARRFDVSPIGSGLAAFAFSASGFFVIHMPHPWGYTTGSWMPWAWGLTWSILSSDRSNRPGRLFLLSLVLVLQILPGHFQLAFLTQVGIALMALCYLLDRSVPRERDNCEAATLSWAGRLRHLVPLALCLAMVFPLAAIQLWPTARLARLTTDQRDFDYLSLCAATPLHLVNFVAPGLFHHSPLWRPLVWTPFHTSPEEHLAYVGLVPLFLALLATHRASRRDSGVRVLTVIAIITVILSLGPFFPGFRHLIALPGFSYFRAPARWTLATSLALAILAGKALDGCREWDKSGRTLGWMAALSCIWVLVTLGILELALGSGSTVRSPWLAGLFQRGFQARPWPNDPEFPAVLAQARNPGGDPRVPAVLERAGVASHPVDSRSFLESRHEIYLRELAGTGGLLAGIVVVASLSSIRAFRQRRSFLPAALIVLTAADLLVLGQHRLVSIAPARPLVEQSPVLAALAREPRGTRIVDGSRNLMMLVGLEPVSAYRTLDLPALEPLNAWARGPLGAEQTAASVRKALRAAGVGVRVLDPIEVALERWLDRSKGSAESGDAIDDPNLAGWLFGPDWRAEQGSWASQFRIVHPEPDASRAWFLPLTEVTRPAMLDSWSGNVESVLELFDRARPLKLERPSPEHVELAVEVDSPGWVLITQLADPQWHARWKDEAGLEVPAEILPTFRRSTSEGGWQRVQVPGPGRWTLHLDYQAHDVREGLAISAVAWLAWGVALAITFRRQRRRRE